MKSEKYRNNTTRGFTIIELLVVIIVIGILVTIVTVAYNGVTDNARDATLQVDVDGAAMLLEKYKAKNRTYPQDPKLANDGKELPVSNGNTINYKVSIDGKDYCVDVTSDGVSYRKSSIVGKVEVGDCTIVSFSLPVIVDGSKMQTIRTANCPSTRTRAVDARDNHTYWVQKLADGKCWMLTNLAYAGDGTNTYGDTKSLLTDEDYLFPNSEPYYFIPSGSNATSNPTDPSTSTDGGETSPQYGYLYNWCGAMGGQSGNAACNSGNSTQPDVNTTICPAGWRLPTGGPGSEFVTMNNIVNSGSTSSLSGLLNTWMIQFGGMWGAFPTQGSFGYYWSSTVSSVYYAYMFYSTTGSIYPSNDSSRSNSFAVRCVAM